MAHIGYSWSTFDALTQQVVKTINPKRILDIGAGGGKYGALLKDVVPECELTALECDDAAFPQLREVGYHHILPITADKLYERGNESTTWSSLETSSSTCSTRKGGTCWNFSITDRGISSSRRPNACR